jgi:hypothetical protein
VTGHSPVSVWNGRGGKGCYNVWVSEERCMVRSMEGGGEGMSLCGGAGNTGYKCTRSGGEVGLCREGQGNGYQGHIGIYMVREGM